MNIKQKTMVLCLLIAMFSFSAISQTYGSIPLPYPTPPKSKPYFSWFKSTVSNEEAIDLMIKAETFFNDGDYLPALKIYRKVAFSSPTKSQVAHLEVVRCHLFNGFPKLAKNWLNAYVKIYEESTTTLNLHGQTYNELRQYKKAIKAYEASLKLENSAEIHFLLSLTYDKLGMHSKTIEHAQQAVQLDPDYKKKLQPLIKNGNLARDIGQIVDEVLRETEDSQLTDEQINAFAKRVGDILGEENVIGINDSLHSTENSTLQDTKTNKELKSDNYDLEPLK